MKALGLLGQRHGPSVFMRGFGFLVLKRNRSDNLARHSRNQNISYEKKEKGNHGAHGDKGENRTFDVGAQNVVPKNQTADPPCRGVTLLDHSCKILCHFFLFHFFFCRGGPMWPPSLSFPRSLS
jgi:hypothetical protein